MEHRIKGYLKIAIPEGKEIKVNAEERADAIEKMLEELVENGELFQYITEDGLDIKRTRKVFKVRVTETFVHEVEIDTDDVVDVEDEYDARRYVENNLDDLAMDFDYDYFTRESSYFDCDSCDTREIDEDC